MGATKTDQFPDHTNKIANSLRALAHPARIAIVEMLLKVDSCICNDFVLELPLAQPTISQHLKELKTAGLIKGSIEGNSICYCLNEEAFKEVEHFFSNISKIVSAKKACC